MNKFDLYEDIAKRTEGDIYLGLVGPVRTGKSTFIKRFMETIVMPYIQDSNQLERARDELPQSSGGKQIMTTEPKFIPDEAVDVVIGENITMKVKMIDCVGYMVEGAIGYEDEEGPRMVSTPWFDEEIPFEEAAEIGTQKVIQEHSTMGIVVTTDGSITGISRENYLEAEDQVIEELKEIGKPFVVVLNSTDPYSEDALEIKEELTEKHNVPVIPVNILEMREEEINQILQEVLYEFPVKEVSINLPNWVEELEPDHWLRESFESSIKESIEKVTRLRDINQVVDDLEELEYSEQVDLEQMDLGSGHAVIDILASEELFEQILSEISGEQIDSKGDLLRIFQEFAHAKKEFDKVEEALETVKDSGYGVVPPSLEEMTLEEPEIVRHGNRFGVRLKASAPSIHMVRVNVQSEFSPIVGTEKQSEDLVNYIMEEFEENPEKIWERDIFGKSLHSVVQDGIGKKLDNMPPNAREKLKETLEKVINEGSGGLIAIIL
ncbi:stage IV sporulation protein A [Natranaerobius thermophilus]|uniref:Stage IV sporulation protein A n=1 Tax=Natranaerobius thermophilus (strain ATCC BAA-1301 / DSM 18059 / JW/NM-WN-LF) TaxID=457570 RepID=B2A4M4_NATTJ|nr:stage IV sporulation protein A [Natranaerobius thermophilus]ACB85199.1 stage IV sporulation protein A [Natranaerobius thermophilus JW/NM-WN-LF]